MIEDKIHSVLGCSQLSISLWFLGLLVNYQLRCCGLGVCPVDVLDQFDTAGKSKWKFSECGKAFAGLLSC